MRRSSPSISLAELDVVDGRPRVSTTPIGYDIVDGHIPASMPNIVTGSVQGAGATACDMWGGAPGTPVCPTLDVAVAMEVLGGAQDTASGTGAASVHIHYLDAVGAVQAVTITMTGSTPVAMPEDVLHVQALHVQSGGSGSSDPVTASGDIIVRTVAGATAMAIIPAGTAIAPRFCFRVPAGMTGHLAEFIGSIIALSNNQTGCLRIVANQDHDSALLPLGVWLPYWQLEGGQGGTTIAPSLSFPLVFTAGVVLKARARRSSGSGAVGASLMARGWIS